MTKRRRRAARKQDKHERIMKFIEDGVFVIFDGVKIAKRGGDATWVSLEPGWQVFGGTESDLVIEYNGTRVQ